MLNYTRATIGEISRELGNHAATVSGVLSHARERIADVDSDGPGLNAVLEMNPQAEGMAALMDAQLCTGHGLGPLHGIPVLLKDNIDTVDMMHTSAGSLALANRYAPRDAFIVQRLRAAGALILGKTNMTEFANYVAEDMPDGYSSRGGQVKNPWGESLDPGGSSTGSAVAVAAGYVPAAIGTETMGSIIHPAGQNGVVGLKPTVGLLSRSGVLPISISQDTPGPMARSVADCALLLDVMAGPDPSDPYTLNSQAASGYAQAAHPPRSLSGYNIGVFNVDENGKTVHHSAFLAGLNALRRMGATLVEVAMPRAPWDDMSTIFANEFRTCMDFALRDSVGCPNTLADIVVYNAAHGEACLRYGQANLEGALEAGKGFNSPRYLRARRAVYDKYTCPVNQLFDEGRLSCIITPTCSTFAVAGYPSLTIPVGMHAGCPVPMVFNGRAFSEHTLIKLAAAVEAAVGRGESPDLA